MRFIETGLSGAFLVEPEKHQDERGFFARTWCAREFAEHGVERPMVQSNVSSNPIRGTLRGLHFQNPPSREGKLIRCSKGKLFDVIVDIRIDSATFLEHFSVILTDTEHQSLYIPPGFAHGFQTLEDMTEATYLMTDFFEPELSAGARWDDPAFSIAWPITEPTLISDRDANCPDFDSARFDRFRGYS